MGIQRAYDIPMIEDKLVDSYGELAFIVTCCILAGIINHITEEQSFALMIGVSLYASVKILMVWNTRYKI